MDSGECVSTPATPRVRRPWHGVRWTGLPRCSAWVRARSCSTAWAVPLVASGGAGAPEHFRDVFVQADVDGALAASVFHSGAIEVAALKRWLAGQGVAVRVEASREREDA